MDPDIHSACQNTNAKNNKKVLLRERKRHTASRVASARYAALCNGGGGYPISGRGGYPVSGLWLGGTPSQVGGVPHLRSGGTPSQVWGGTMGTPPDLRWGTSLPRPGMGYLPT